jgi:uncharacterized damage-inducible protein DinB
MTPEQIRELFDFNAWANQRMLDACGALTDEQSTRDLGNSFPSVRDTLAHILGAEWIWLERWQGRLPTALLSPGDFADLAAIRARWVEVERDVRGFVGRLSADDLARVQQVWTLKGEPYSHPLWQMIQHLVNYGSYHRGQITMMLRVLGAKPIGTDLIAFYRERAKA